MCWRSWAACRTRRLASRRRRTWFCASARTMKCAGMAQLLAYVAGAVGLEARGLEGLAAQLGSLFFVLPNPTMP